jgi:protocatechuate 3,4-dioxygenase beta subunit
MLAQAGQPPQTPRANGLLAGRVVDAAGDPVGGAVVIVRNNATTAPPPQSGILGGPTPVRTDAEGRFVFTDVPPGSYQVGATKSGWLAGAVGRRRPGGSDLPVVLSEAQHRNDLTITLWRPAVIAGLVTADNGDPLVGVEVRAVQLVHIAGRRQMFTPQRPLTIARQKTDDRGAYRFSDLMPGDYVIAVLASVLSEPPGFTGAIRAANATPRSYYQTMTATAAAPIVFDRATGVAPGGRALVDSLTGLSGVPATDGAWPIYPTTYHPSAITQSTATIVRAISGEPQTAINVDVRMIQTYQVSGVLTGPEGPASWHAVHLVQADTGEMPLVDVGTAVTDGDGAFTFYGVPPGQYVARVVRVPWPGPGLDMGIAGGTGAIPYIAVFGRGPSGGPPTSSAEPLLYASQSVTVGDRHVRDLALTLSEGLRVRGRVVLEGTAAAPAADLWRTANVSLASANGREDNAVFPNPLTGEGPFTSPGVWPGKYLLRVSPPRGWTLLRAVYQGRDISASAIDLAADIENVVVTLTNRVRSVKGSVQVEAGSRASDAVVLMFPVDQEGWIDFGRSSRRVSSTRAAEDGTFSMPAPPDGEYFMIAISDEDTDDWQNPATLSKLAAAADRFRMQGDGPTALSLRLRRIQ